MMDRKWQTACSITSFLLISVTIRAAAQTGPNCTNTTQIDLCFLIDRSGSICDTDPKFSFSNVNDTTCDNWSFIVGFVYQFVTDLYVGQNDVRVAVVIFDDYAHLKWNLTGYLDKTSLLNAINTTLDYDKGKRTNTSDGLNMMASEVFNAVDRPKALRTSIIITDGRPTDPEAAYDAVDKVHALNITTYVVGVTNAIDESTLRRLSTQPAEENVTYFIAQTYSTIGTVRNQVLAQTCLRPSTSTSTTTTTTTTTTPTTTITTTTTTTTPRTTTTATAATTFPSTSAIPAIPSTSKLTGISASSSTPFIATPTLLITPTTTFNSNARNGTSTTIASGSGPTPSRPFTATPTLLITPTSFNSNVSVPGAAITTNSRNGISTTIPTNNLNVSGSVTFNPMGNFTTISRPASMNSSSSQATNSVTSIVTSSNSGQTIVSGSSSSNNNFTASSTMNTEWDLWNGTRSTTSGTQGLPTTSDITPQCSLNCASGCNISTGASKCDRCYAGYGLTANGFCGKCSPNCSAGCNNTGASKCDRCDIGYGLRANGSCGSDINFASVGPLRGPIAGGTSVTISGAWPSVALSVTAVYIGTELKGAVVEVSRLGGVDQVVFITPSTDEVGNLPLVVQFSGYYPDPEIYITFNVSTGRYFSYSDNPRIWEVFPRAHLVSGGTMLTAVGTNLTSIGYSAIQATVEVCRYNNYGQPLTCTRTSRTRPCEGSDVQNQLYPTELICKMPQIDLPLDFLDILDNVTIPANMSFNVTPRTKRNIDSSAVHSRRKRSTSQGSVQSLTGTNGKDTADIYLRFILDGFQGNELENILRDTRFYFFTAPEITSSHEVVLFNPDEDVTIPINGKHMLRGCAKGDYTIRLGKGNCSISQLTDNQLTCSPPQIAPLNTNEFDFYFCDLRFTIVVSIGDKVYYYRCLEYSGPDSPPPGCPVDCWTNSSCQSKWKQTVLIVGLVIGLVLLLLVIVLIICLIVVCARSRKRRTKEEAAGPSNYMRSMGVVHGSLGGNHAALNGGNNSMNGRRSRGSMAEDYLTAAAEAEEREDDVDRISVDSSMEKRESY